jgi:Icc-related predicted phosphoesterase
MKSRDMHIRPIFFVLLLFAVILAGEFLLACQRGYIFKIETPNQIPYTEQEWYKAKIKIGFITDAHANSKIIEKNKYVLLSDSVSKIKYFVDTMENEFHPDIVVSGGDIIDGTRWPENKVIGTLGEIEDLFDMISAPKLYVLGNHDIRTITKDKWKESLEVDYLHTSVDIGKYRIITLDSNFQADGTDVFPKNQFIRGNVSNEEMNWLESCLRDNDQIKLVFLHHPPMTFLPDKSPTWLLKNADKLQKIFEKYKVTAVFAGHIQYLYHEKINGVQYYLLPGMDESANHPDSFAEIDMTRKKAMVTLVQKNADNAYESVLVE